MSLADTRNVIVATACNNAFRVLRTHENLNLYVYYYMYDVTKENLCKSYEVNLINTHLPFIPKIPQMMVPCFDRSTITELEKKPTEFRYFYDILIYPSSQTFTSWLVFQRDQTNQNYFLKMSLKINDFMGNLIPIRLLSLPAPIYSTEKYKIFFELYPFLNIWDNVVV